MQYINNFDLCQADPVHSALLLSLLWALLFEILMLFTGNYSWVDRFWSILPFFYAVFGKVLKYSCHGILNTSLTKENILLILIGLWAARLTYNFVRKGGYKKGQEDYRWEYVRKDILPKNIIVVHLFMFFFIALYQCLLICLFSSPILTLQDGPILPQEAVLLVCIGGCLLGETLSDQQQWNYQSAKKQYLKRSNKPRNLQYQRGFITSGLFKYSRHPNFFFQMSFWTLQALLGYVGVGLHLSQLGCILLILLFHASTNLTEKITLGKYSLYKVYQNQTSRIIPWLSSHKQKI